MLFQHFLCLNTFQGGGEKSYNVNSQAVIWDISKCLCVRILLGWSGRVPLYTFIIESSKFFYRSNMYFSMMPSWSL